MAVKPWVTLCHICRQWA